MQGIPAVVRDGAEDNPRLNAFEEMLAGGDNRVWHRKDFDVAHGGPHCGCKLRVNEVIGGSAVHHHPDGRAVGTKRSKRQLRRSRHERTEEP